MTWDSAGQITQFASTQPAQGGDDLIDVGDGANIVVGGFGGDTINTGEDADIVLGDDGQVDYVVADADATDIDLIESRRPRSTAGPTSS